MGWKPSCIFINQREPGFLGSNPRLDEVGTVALLQRLGHGPIRSWRLSSLDDMSPPESAAFGVGDYQGGAILSAVAGITWCAERGGTPLVEKLLALFPSASILVFELASAVNYYSYALYVHGARVRAHAGDAEHGVLVDYGAIQPEEEPLYRASKLQGGRRLFRIEGEWCEIYQAGEALVFALASRFLGQPLDEFPLEDIPLMKIRRPWRLWPFRTTAVL